MFLRLPNTIHGQDKIRLNTRAHTYIHNAQFSINEISILLPILKKIERERITSGKVFCTVVQVHHLLSWITNRCSLYISNSHTLTFASLSYFSSSLCKFKLLTFSFFLSESENAMDFQLLFPQLSQPINNNYNIISVIE